MGICLIVKSGGGTDTSNANVTADKILSGYTVYSNDNKITGTMYNAGNQCKTDPNIGSTDGSFTLWPDWNFGIWGGYHDGTATLKVGSLADATGCDIPNQWWCLTGYSYWANGSKYDGAMVNRGAKTWSIGANGTQTIEDGWHNGSGTVKQSINVDTGEWGPTPTTTNQQLCWQGWYYSKNRWCWGNGNLVAGNIKKGVSIFGVTGNYVETKRWLIQNGAYVSSLISLHAYTGGLPSNTTTTYNGATWKLIADNDYSWVDEDEGGYTNWYRWTVVSSIASLCTITSNTYIGCKVHGDILCYGWSDSGALHKTYKWYIIFGLGNTSRKAQSDTTAWVDSPWVGSVPSFSNGLKYYSGHSGTPNTSLVIDARMNCSGNSHQWSVYAKNLWLETTESVSWS